MFRGISDRGIRRIAGNVPDKIPGGLADGKPRSDFPKGQLDKGVKVEMEHTDDPEVAEEIAMDHLDEDREYYKKLHKMETGKCCRRFSYECMTDASLSRIASRIAYEEFGVSKDQISDQAKMAPSEVRAENDATQKDYQQQDIYGLTPWKDPHRTKYTDQTKGFDSFPGDMPPIEEDEVDSGN